MRVAQYGWTPDRVWAALVVFVGLIYAMGYSGSLLRRGSGWMSGIAPANVLAALAMGLGIILLLSPVFDVNRLATASQMTRLASGRLTPENFDLYALTRQGRAGHEALRVLEQHKGVDGKPDALSMRAAQVRHDAHQYGHAHEKPGLAFRYDVARLTIYPAGKTLPDGFAAFLANEVKTWRSWQRDLSCFAKVVESDQCYVLLQDMNGDGQDEVIFWMRSNDPEPFLFISGKGGWRTLGQLSVERPLPASGVSGDLSQGDFGIRNTRWLDLQVGETRFRVLEASK